MISMINLILRLFLNPLFSLITSNNEEEIFYVANVNFKKKNGPFSLLDIIPMVLQSKFYQHTFKNILFEFSKALKIVFF
jgi:hypothetical protein